MGDWFESGEYAWWSSWDWNPATLPWLTPPPPGIMRWSVTRTVEPISDPVFLEDVKMHLRVDNTEEDAYIQDLITGAVEYIEQNYQVAYLAQTNRLTLDHFPMRWRLEKWPWSGTPYGSILLPGKPVTGVVSVNYLDTNGDVQVVDSTIYAPALQASPLSKIVLKPGNNDWPRLLLGQPSGGVYVDYTLGYTNLAKVPKRWKQALYLLVASWYENREEVGVEYRTAMTQPPLGMRDIMGHALPPLVG